MAAEVTPDLQLADPSLWEAMSPERKDLTLRLRDALASGPLAELGVTEESLLVLGGAGISGFTLVHTGVGIDLGKPGSYDVRRGLFGVTGDEYAHLFKTNIGGRHLDLLSGMTGGVYRAMVAAVVAKGQTPPDIEYTVQDPARVETSTVLTGEAPLNYHVLVAHVHEAGFTPHIMWGDRMGGNPGQSHRPAVAIP